MLTYSLSLYVAWAVEWDRKATEEAMVNKVAAAASVVAVVALADSKEATVVNSRVTLHLKVDLLEATVVSNLDTEVNKASEVNKVDSAVNREDLLLNRDTVLLREVTEGEFHSCVSMVLRCFGRGCICFGSISRWLRYMLQCSDSVLIVSFLVFFCLFRCCFPFRIVA
jgi:hypothetical protein